MLCSSVCRDMLPNRQRRTFSVFKDRVITPRADCFLNGITRQIAINLAQSLGVKVKEGLLPLNDIGEATEVFLTGTAYEITPVTRIDAHHYPVGPITRSIQGATGTSATAEQRMCVGLGDVLRSILIQCERF